MKCSPNYKNLEEVASSGEQKYATVQWANQNCENDEYLKQKTDELSYLSPPAVRKRFSPILLDEAQSWGCQINPNKTITFNSATSQEFTIDFRDFSLIDENRTTVAFENIITDGVGLKKAIVPLVDEYTVNYDCRNFSPGDSINSFWYVGYDKSKSYRLSPDWIKDCFDSEIPSVVRAQTFTIPQGASGYLDSVDLQIENNGTSGSNWGSPLIVQIWKTVPRTVNKTIWDNATRKSITTTAVETIYWPSGNPSKPLAQSIYDPTKTDPHFQNFLFDTPIKVEAGEHYALVILSPLSHWGHCPRIGGWGRNCYHDKYPGGDAFLSEHNGHNFIQYGRNDDSVDYRFGQLTPQDFAFQFHIKQYSSVRIANEDFYLYLKPIHTNPVKKVEINSIGKGDESSESDMGTLRFEISQDGKTWVSLGNDFSQEFAVGNYPQIIFIRAVLNAATTAVNNAPYLEKFKVTLDLDIPKELYARTHFYHPKIGAMLGANLWGRVYAPFTLEPTVTGSVEIIQEKLKTEHFTIITGNELSNYTYIDDETGNLKSSIEGLDPEMLTSEDPDERYMYLIENPETIEILKAQNIYVKPYEYYDESEGVYKRALLSFEEGIQFTNSPAYPIQEALLQPDGNNTVVGYSEWLDYTFDYDNDVLNFYDEVNNDVIDNLQVGNLAVSYNPVFIQDLSNDEVGLRENDEGLILDYFKEDIIIREDMISTGLIPLRVSAVDPLREVVLNDETTLREDVDFTVDYINNQLCFEVDSLAGVVLKLNMNDVLSVVYTPNIEETGLAIGYRAKRENTDKNIIIHPNYIEYKV